MIESNLMRGCAGIVESGALLAITFLAIGLMVGAVKLSDVLKHLGTILCIAALLLMLPAIIATAWSSMSYWQQLCFVILSVVSGLSIRTLARRR